MMTETRLRKAVGLMLLLICSLPATAAGDKKDAPEAEEPSQHAESTERNKPSEEDTPSERGESSEHDSRQLLEEASDIARQVSDIRGLDLRDDIDKGIRDRDQLRELLVAQLDEEIGDRDLEHEARVLKQLDLVPDDLDYRETLLDVLTEQIAGFYDDDTAKLYIMKGIPLYLQRPAMAHEIFHAIQDQHFDLERLVEPISSKENSDFSMARSSMVEGDATLLMLDYSLYESGLLPVGNVKSLVDAPDGARIIDNFADRGLGAITRMSPPEGGDKEDDQGEVDPSQFDASALSNAPRVIRKLLVFPYFGGMKFVAAARRDTNWENIDRIYESAPTSTEQLLHPERYFEGDDPVHLDFDAEPIDELGEPIYDNVLGEYQMRLFFEEHLLDDEQSDQQSEQVDLIDRALTGWGGDRIRAWDLGDERLLLTHLSQWDTLTDAAEYFEALVRVVRHRYPGSEITFEEGKHGESACFVIEGDGGKDERVYLERWGDLVLHIEGAPSRRNDEGQELEPTTYTVRERTMDSVERTPFEEVLEERVEEFDQERARSEEDRDE